MIDRLALRIYSSGVITFLNLYRCSSRYKVILHIFARRRKFKWAICLLPSCSIIHVISFFLLLKFSYDFFCWLKHPKREPKEEQFILQLSHLFPRLQIAGWNAIAFGVCAKQSNKTRVQIDCRGVDWNEWSGYMGALEGKRHIRKGTNWINFDLRVRWIRWMVNWCCDGDETLVWHNSLLQFFLRITI